MGIHSGDVMMKEDSVYGDSVNISSRIESMSVPGSVLMSKVVSDQIRNQKDVNTRSIGHFHFKNVDQPMEVFALMHPELAIPDTNKIKGKLADTEKPKLKSNKNLVFIISFHTMGLQNINRDNLNIVKYRLALLVAFLVLLMSCSESDVNKAKNSTTGTISKPATDDSAILKNPQNNAYFGDLHVHTSWSFDAFAYNTRTSPDDAYRYGKGEMIDHVGGQKIQLRGGALDFMAVTDHAEYLGVMKHFLESDHPLSKHELAKKVLSEDFASSIEAFSAIGTTIRTGKPIEELLAGDIVKTVWKEIIEAAERHNEPRKFTTFIGYEWTSIPDRQNQHRNVIFRSANVPDYPFSAFDSQIPEDLWTYLETARNNGMEALAIPHNANKSDGKMYQLVDSNGNPIDAEYSRRRMSNEPINEVIQVKGQSETHPTLSMNDEFADFEIAPYLIATEIIGEIDGSYARQAFRNGLVMEQKDGFNPYKFGMIGASDTHNSGAPVEEDRYFGKIGVVDHTPESRLDDESIGDDFWSAAGLAGVWAASNTREALFDAMKRKEVFATSGPRMKVRFFAGWDYDEDILQSENWVERAYESGVPMGGDISRSNDQDSPDFLVWAVKDANNANLDRVQIIKAWVDREGNSHEKVYDVAWSAGREIDESTGKLSSIGTSVDLETVTYTNSIGAVELKSLWQDPDFDVDLYAMYYVRALEIPTPRWSTYDAKALGIDPPEHVPSTIQERAISSPIWYQPTE